MKQQSSPAAIAALVYSAGTDPAPVLRAMAADLSAKGLVCAGFIQRDTVRPERSRCDMVLEEIRTGTAIPISEDRGPGARGCRLDEAELTRAMMACAEALRHEPDVLFINKFGKTEAEGRGFRPLIAEALERGVPVLIAVSWTNIDNWRCFAGDFSVEVPLGQGTIDIDELCERLGVTVSGEARCKMPDAKGPEAEPPGVDVDG